jgi:hypothetical protein
MAFTQQQLDAIDEAIASGELVVKYNGKEITYRSMDELLKARNVISESLAPQVPGSKNMTSVVEFCRD